MFAERWRDPLYLALFIALVGGLWGVTLSQTREWAETIQVLGNSVVIAAAITLTVREVVEMLAEAFRKKMREWAWEKGVEEGIERGREEGIELGEQRLLDRMVNEAYLTEEQRKQIESNGHK